MSWHFGHNAHWVCQAEWSLMNPLAGTNGLHKTSNKQCIIQIITLANRTLGTTPNDSAKQIGLWWIPWLGQNKLCKTSQLGILRLQAIIFLVNGTLGKVPNEFATQKGLWWVPWPKRNELHKTSQQQCIITSYYGPRMKCPDHKLMKTDGIDVLVRTETWLQGCAQEAPQEPQLTKF